MSSGTPPSPQYQPFPPPQYAAAPPPPSHEKPTAAMVLSIIGGVFILLGGITEISIASAINLLSFGLAGAYLAAFGALGVVMGVLIILFAIFLYTHTSSHTIFGVLIIVFSVISLTSFVGGFFIGFLLALIGGILAAVWKPAPPPVIYQAPQRMCPKCGRAVDPNIRFCPYCGNAMP